MVPSQVFPCTAVVVGKSLVVVVVVGKSLVAVVGKLLVVAVVGKSPVAVVGKSLVGLGCWWGVECTGFARNTRHHHLNTGCPYMWFKELMR